MEREDKVGMKIAVTASSDSILLNLRSSFERLENLMLPKSRRMVGCLLLAGWGDAYLESGPPLPMRPTA